jgi:DNA-3-methyladenine glycosylase
VRGLPRRFYSRPTLTVARELLGKELVWRGHGAPMGGVIVEVEAYLGASDPASHAFRGETRRNRTMFGAPGHAYVYFTYGMHHCLNVVTEEAGTPHAILLRALAPTTGLDLWRAARPDLPLERIASGPGRLCRALGLDRSHDGLDLTNSDLVVRARPERALAEREVRSGPRIGIRLARALPYRFWLAHERAVSGPRKQG